MCTTHPHGTWSEPKMAIPWNFAQRQAVTHILGKYPPDSNRCRDAAEELLPLAQEQAATARVLRVRPKGRARYIVPRIKRVEPWYEHFTTEVVFHCVDALTGPDGTRVEDYLETHWEHPEHLEFQAP